MTNTHHITDYASAEAWLLSMTDYERMLGSSTVRYDTKTFDLANFRTQLSKLGDPHLKYAVIHVAGTKGKGSTCAFLESALRYCGFRTGMFTSPHLFKFTERIRLDGQEIPEIDFCRLIEKMSTLMAPAAPVDKEIAENSPGFRTVFEILTASAFEYFRENRVDIAIIETGLGGRLDSTNMFDQIGAGPLINVITAIGLDHTAILGDTIKAITTEKAGIIRSHARTVVAPQRLPKTQAIVRSVIMDHCREVTASSPVIVNDWMNRDPHDSDPDCYRYTLKPGATQISNRLTNALSEGFELCPSLHGEHQAGNVSTALMALLELETSLQSGVWNNAPSGGLWPVLDPDLVRKGFENTSWPGRFQVFEGEIPVVIDGAHCAISAGALGRASQKQFTGRPVVLITGFLRDKAGKDMLTALVNEIPVIQAVAIVPPTPRAVSADHIIEALSGHLPVENIATAIDMAEAFKLARKAARFYGGYIVVFGSLYLVGPALNEADPPQD